MASFAVGHTMRVTILFIVGLASVAAASTAPAMLEPKRDAHRCAAGSRHAIIGGKHACLRVGARCQRRFDARYHRYGFHCHGARLTRRRAAPPAPAPPPRADLALTVVDDPDPVRAGAELTLTLTVTNAGPSGAARVVVATEQLAAQINSGAVQVVRLAGPCAASFGVISCVFGDVAVGSTTTATVVLRPMSAMTLAATWHVTPSDTLRTEDTNTANNFAPVTTVVTG